MQEKSVAKRVQTFIPELESREVVLLDRSDPRALINLVPNSMVEAMEKLAFEHPEYLNQDERTLLDLFRAQVAEGRIRDGLVRVNATDKRLRISFWIEYDRAQAGKRVMGMSNVFSGVCTRMYFDNEVLHRPGKLAWILTPPVAYTNVMEEALVFGVEKLRDILDIDLKDAKGQVNVKAGELLLKTIQFLDARVKGAIVQKVDTRSLVVTGNLDKPKDSEPMTLEDVQRQLQQLEIKARDLVDGRGAPPKVKVVEVLDAE